MTTFAPVDDFRPPDGSKKTVAYFYDADVGNYAYPAGHPMKPHRIRLAHSLIMNYGLYKDLEIYVRLMPSRWSLCISCTDRASALNQLQTWK